MHAAFLIVLEDSNNNDFVGINFISQSAEEKIIGRSVRGKDHKKKRIMSSEVCFMIVDLNVLSFCSSIFYSIFL